MQQPLHTDRHFLHSCFVTVINKPCYVAAVESFLTKPNLWCMAATNLKDPVLSAQDLHMLLPSSQPSLQLQLRKQCSKPCWPLTDKQYSKRPCQP